MKSEPMLSGNFPVPPRFVFRLALFRDLETLRFPVEPGCTPPHTASLPWDLLTWLFTKMFFQPPPISEGVGGVAGGRRQKFGGAQRVPRE